MDLLPLGARNGNGMERTAVVKFCNQTLDGLLLETNHPTTTCQPPSSPDQNRTILNYFRAYSQEDSKDWELLFPSFEFHYNMASDQVELPKLETLYISRAEMGVSTGARRLSQGNCHQKQDKAEKSS